MTAARIKDESRLIASTSERTLATHVIGSTVAYWRCGVWNNKPKNLSPGAKASYEFAQYIYDTKDVYPIDMRYQLAFDKHGYSFVPDKSTAAPLRKIGMVSKSAPSTSRHEQKNVSSDHREAQPSDNKFKAITIHRHDLISHCGKQGNLAMTIPCLKSHELNMPLAVVKICGLGYGNDMKANTSDYGYVFLTRKKGKDKNEEMEASVSVQMSAIIINELLYPFLEELRRGQGWDVNTPIPDSMKAVFTLDSDIPFLSVLKRPEIVSEFDALKLSVLKVAAGFTECGASCDCQDKYRNTKRAQKETSVISSDTDLKQQIKSCFNILKERNIINFTPERELKLTDAIASQNSIDDKAIKGSETIQEGAFRTGCISKTADGKGYNSCPDLYAQIQTTKNASILKNIVGFQKKLYHIAKHFLLHGCIDEDVFDNSCDGDGNMYFPVDKHPTKKIEVPKVFQKGQYHLMRTILPHSEQFVQTEKKRREQLKNKEHNDILKVFEECKSIYETYTDISRKILDPIANGKPYCKIPVEEYFKLNRAQLKAFIAVRMSRTLHKEDIKSIPGVKGPMSDFGPLSDGDAFKNQMQMMYTYVKKEVIAEEPKQPALPVITATPLSLPEVISFEENKFVLNDEWIQHAFSYIGNLKDLPSNLLDEYKKQKSELDTPQLASILKSRLLSHLNSFPKLNKTRPEWRFALRNVQAMAVLLKMLGYTRDDNILRATEWHETLFDKTFMCNHELLTIEHAPQHGAYLMIHKGKGVFIHAGSASSRFGHESITNQSDKGRVNSLITASKKEPSSDLYMFYPHKDSPHIRKNLQRGVFQDLAFVPALRFLDTDKKNVQELFDFSDMTRFLESKANGPNKAEDVKHRLICYLFEITRQMCLGKDDNISSNPGFQTFCPCDLSNANNTVEVDSDRYSSYLTTGDVILTSEEI